MQAQGNRTILIVEDEVLIGKMTEETLQNMGYQALVVSSGDEALDVVNNQNIDLVLMDIKLEKSQDGIDTARLIHEQNEIPILFYSSHFDKENLDKIKDMTYCGIIEKHTGELTLKNYIEMALKLFYTQLEKDRTFHQINHKINKKLINNN